MKTCLVINDIHFPHHVPKLLHLILRFCAGTHLDEVVINGDMVDFPSLSSKFDQAPLDPAGLDKEIRHVRTFLLDLRAVVPADCKITWLGGNHEDRLWRFLCKKRQTWLALGKRATALVTDALSFESLFGLGEFGVTYKPYGDDHKLGNLTVTHGDIVRAHSAYSARGTFEKAGVSTLVGHTHRLGAHFKTNKAGIHGVWENGCLCTLKPDYMKNPDWQHGFAVIHVADSGLFNVQQIPILQQKMFFYGGTQWVI